MTPRSQAPTPAASPAATRAVARAGAARADAGPGKLDEAFAEVLTRRCGVPRGDKLVVAVSGGADSVALLLLLVDFRRRHGWPDLHVAHLDHALRGAAGRRDAAAVRTLCRRHGLPCTLETLPPWAAPPSEDELRRARHAFLERVARQCGAGRIALAHHRRDQAETVLWHLARGSGRRGLGGMRAVSGRRIRPLLDFSAADLRAYLRRRRIRWREDATNRDPAYTRNRVRALIALLEQRVHSAAERNLARAAAILAEEDEYLDALAARRLRAVRVKREVRGEREGTATGRSLMLRVDRLTSDPPALARRVLRGAVRRLTRGRLSLSLARTERLAALAGVETRTPEERCGSAAGALIRGAPGGQARVDLGGGVRAERRGRLLVLLDLTLCRNKILRQDRGCSWPPGRGTGKMTR
jgi:tRNA(Ile)-lysidine synthase